MYLFLFYLIKVTVCSGILFGYYWLFLRNKVFNNYNRFYLLFLVIVSLCFPIINSNIFNTDSHVKNAVIKVLKAVSDGNEYMDEVIIGVKNKVHINVEMGLMILYSLVSLFLFLILVKMLYKIYLLFKNNPKEYVENIHVIFTHNEPSTPFSFFNLVFWNKENDLNTAISKNIFSHEKAHINQKHSWDKMMLSIVITVFWCNPIFWLVRKELSMIHEFIADKKAIITSNKATLAAMILATIYPMQQITITNNFFHSPIKRRIMMFTKQQKNGLSYISRILILPIVFILFAAFSYRWKGSTHSANTDKQIIVVLDAGHGGIDAGAKSKEGIKEKDVSLALIKAIKANNDNKNVKIILSRNDDIFMDVFSKAEFANAQKPDLFISVHIDATQKNNIENNTGMKVIIAKNQFENSQKSNTFASSIIQIFKSNYNLPVLENPIQRKHGIYILENVKAASVLIEAGYITNKTDLQYLQSSEGQTTFAKNILTAINNYANEYNKINTEEIVQPLNDTLYYLNGKVVDKTYWQNHNMSFKILNIDILNTKQKKDKYGINYEGVVIYATTASINEENNSKEKKATTSNSNIIFTAVEKEAEFPGGTEEWKKYLQKNLNASIPIKEGWKAGTYNIIVSFIVEKDGSLNDITAENYTNSKTAKSCVALIAKGPKWKPATQNGHIVTAYRKQPITFVVAAE